MLNWNGGRSGFDRGMGFVRQKDLTSLSTDCSTVPPAGHAPFHRRVDVSGESTYTWNGRVNKHGPKNQLAGCRRTDRPTVGNLWLELGKLADFIVIDRDLLARPVDEVKDVQVELTYLGGKIVFERKK